MAHNLRFERNALLKFSDATPDDVAIIAALQNASAGALTARHGEGHWSGLVTERGVLSDLRHARVRVGRIGKHAYTVLRLATKKPWAIDVSCFTAVKRPLYLTGMAVAVAHQGQGFGRQALEDAVAVARAWPADAIRLDAYDAAAGAGRFYARCGYQERGRVVYKGDPLIYFELLLGDAGARQEINRTVGQARAVARRVGLKQRDADAAIRRVRRRK